MTFDSRLPATGRSAQRVRCAIDGSSEAEFVLRPATSDGPLVRCRRCGLFYISPRESDFTLRDFAGGVRTNTYHSLLAKVGAARLAAFEEVSVDDENIRKRAFRQRLVAIRGFTAAGRHLLDVGCERGYFLELASRDFSVSGVEADVNTSAYARSRGLDVFTGTLHEAHYPGESFDVVTAFHFLEHVDQPLAELREMFRVLRPGGLLVVETPNIRTIWFHLLRSRWRQFIWDHYYFFDPQTISLLLREAGFTKPVIRTIGKPVNAPFGLARLARYWKGFLHLAKVARWAYLDRIYFTVNLGDILIAFARKAE